MTYLLNGLNFKLFGDGICWAKGVEEAEQVKSTFFQGEILQVRLQAGNMKFGNMYPPWN